MGERLSQLELPQEYIAHIRGGGRTEEFLKCEFPAYMQLWPLDTIDEFNRGYETRKHAPGFLCFGSNGGGELLAFDENCAIYCLSAIGMEPTKAIRVADSWTDFARLIEGLEEQT